MAAGATGCCSNILQGRVGLLGGIPQPEIKTQLFSLLGHRTMALLELLVCVEANQPRSPNKEKMRREYLLGLLIIDNQGAVFHVLFGPLVATRSIFSIKNPARKNKRGFWGLQELIPSLRVPCVGVAGGGRSSRRGGRLRAMGWFDVAFGLVEQGLAGEAEFAGAGVDLDQLDFDFVALLGDAVHGIDTFPGPFRNVAEAFSAGHEFNE